MRKQCYIFVETYTDLIVDLLTKDVSPEMVCSNKGLCSGKILIDGPYLMATENYWVLEIIYLFK